MYIEDIISACRKIMAGDLDALEELGLDSVSYPRPSGLNTSTSHLQVTYNSVLNTAVAARELQLCFLEKQCQEMLEALQAIALAKKITLQHDVDSTDVAEIMLSLIEEERQRLFSVQPRLEDSSDSVEDQERAPQPPAQDEDGVVQTQPPPPAAASLQPRVQDKVAWMQPPPPAKESMAAGAPTEDETVKIQLATANDTSTLTSKTIQKPSATAADLSTELRRSDSISTVAVEPTQAPGPSSYATATSKNKRRQCPMCSFFGTHLHRHITKKHPDSFTSKAEKVSLVHSHDKLSRKKQGKTPVRQFQCTYRGCGAIITRLGQHMTRVHKIVNERELAQAKAKCVRFPVKSKAATPAPTKQQTVNVAKSQKKERHRHASVERSSSSEEESYIQSGESTSEEHEKVDEHQLKVDADMDDMSSLAESDAADEENIPDGEQQKWRDTYLAKNPNRNVREYFMSRFYKYLIHAEGGAHSDHQALLHARQVHNVLNVLDPQGIDLACLARRGGLDIWDKFCVPKLRNKELTGNTLKTYLRSMEYFVKFIFKGLLYKKDMLNARHKEIILSLRDRLPDYRGTVHRRTAHQVTTRKVDEAFKRLTPADIRQIEASEPAKKAVKLIGLAAEKKALTQSEFVTVRDYLIVTTLYENGSRPGPLENALVTRFKQATYSASSDRYTILVDKHKTTWHHGPAELTLTSRVYGYLQIYALHIRPKFVAPGEDALFVKEDGFAFAPGTVGRRLTQFFKQAGIRQDVRVTATNIRKMISDKAFEMSPTKKRLIHGHMKHQEKTADANYVIRLNADRAAKAHMLMQDILHETTPSAPAAPSPVDETASGYPAKPSPMDTTAPSEPAKTLLVKKTPTSKLSQPGHVVEASEQEDSDDDQPLKVVLRKRRVLDSSDESDNTSSVAASVSSLGHEHKSVLLTVFNDEISSGKLMTMHEERNKMRAHMFLRKMVVHQEFVKKVADFVRYKTNHTRQMQLTQLGDLNDEDGVASLSLESGLRKVWSEHDNAVIKAKFKSKTKAPSKREILATFADDQVLSHILDREGPVRCYEKVKTILKSRCN